MISTFTAFFDANVFFGARLRSLVIELAATNVFRARWSEDVHREWMKAVLDKRPDVSPERLEKTRRQMDAAVPDSVVEGYEPLIPAMGLADSGDDHILAAAITARANVIVTFNLVDFPAEKLKPYGLHAKHPDDFLLDVESLEIGILPRAAARDRNHYKTPPLTFETYLDDINKAGLPKTADYLRQLKVLVEASVDTIS